MVRPTTVLLKAPSSRLKSDSTAASATWRHAPIKKARMALTGAPVVGAAASSSGGGMPLSNCRGQRVGPDQSRACYTQTQKLRICFCTFSRKIAEPSNWNISRFVSSGNLGAELIGVQLCVALWMLCCDLRLLSFLCCASKRLKTRFGCSLKF